VVTPGFLGNCDDRFFAEPQIIVPAPDVFAGWPTLPPAGQGSGIEAQSCQQFFEKIIRDARARALLLLYWFT